VIHNKLKRSIKAISRYFEKAMHDIGELIGGMLKPPLAKTPTKIHEI
jgi:hypothetical protein